METAETHAGGGEAQDVAALALTSALTAQAVCARTNSLNADQAFVCTALRQYGKLLLCTFLPAEYRTALALAQEGSPETSFKSVFGLTTFELAQQILVDAKVSKLIANTLQAVRPQLLQSSNLSDADQLLLSCDFATEVCGVLARADAGAEQCQLDLAQLVKSRARALALTDDDLQAVLETVDRMLGNFGRVQGVETFSSPLLSRIRLVAQGDSSMGQPADGAASRPRAEGAGAKAAADKVVAGDPIQTALREVKELVSASPREPRTIFNLAA